MQQVVSMWEDRHQALLDIQPLLTEALEARGIEQLSLAVAMENSDTKEEEEGREAAAGIMAHVENAASEAEQASYA